MNLDNCIALQCRKCIPANNPFNVQLHYGIGAVLVGHKCFIFGGYKHLGVRVPAKFVYIYNIVDNLWTCVRPENFNISFGRVKMASVVDDNLVAYTWHERDARYNFSKLNLVDLDTWRLVEGKNSPNIGNGTSGCYIESRKEVILFGGVNKSTTLHVYSVERKSWYKVDPQGKPPFPRCNHASCSRGNRMFVVGGTVFGPISPLDIHIVTMRGRNFSWSSPKVSGYIPPSRYLFNVSCSSDRIFVYGGYGGARLFDFYSISENKWYTGKANTNVPPEHRFYFKTDWPQGTEEHAVVQNESSILIFGGFGVHPSTPLLVKPKY